MEKKEKIKKEKIQMKKMMKAMKKKEMELMNKKKNFPNPALTREVLWKFFN